MATKKTTSGGTQAAGKSAPAKKKAVGADKKPAAAGNKPATAGKKLATAGKKPATAGKKPATAGKKPPASAGKKPAAAEGGTAAAATKRPALGKETTAAGMKSPAAALVPVVALAELPRTSVGEIAAPRRAGGAPKPTPSDAVVPESKRVALAVADAALDKKAVNVEIIDVTGKVDYADYVVVMSGRSDRQVQALARGIAEDVEKKTKTRCIGVEGIPQASWVLMDFGDVIVHIFHDDVRGYYDLESLWMDASRVPVPSGGPGA